jgi:hypothetical protein
MTRSILFAALIAASSSLAACIKAPEVVIVDRKTALELQAGGHHASAEEKLEQAAIRPGATPFETREAGSTVARSFDRDDEGATDADLTDALLEKSCVGEGFEGLLVQTPATCASSTDGAIVTSLVERTNRHRRQLWQLMVRKQPGLTEAEAARAWRTVHLRDLPCGARIERFPGQFEVKACP